MTANSGNRNGRREAAALLLAAGRTIKVSARKAGVGERTLRTWMQDDAYRSRILELRSEMFGRAVGRLCSLTAKAGLTLGRLLSSQNEKIRLGAAKAILDGTPKLREAGELAARIDSLEKRMREGGK